MPHDQKRQDRKLFVQRAKRFLKRKVGIYGFSSYSQCGEDLIVRYIFDTLGVVEPSYIDIGAHHPYFLNNTYGFYKTGSRGVNIEPDPTLIKSFNSKRRGDVNLNMGLAGESGELTLYVMSSRTMNTFSKEDAENAKDHGFEIIDTVQIPVMTYPEMCAKHVKTDPDFISLDVEGLDFAILQTIDFDRHKPTALCIETLSYSDSGLGEKDAEMDSYLERFGYFKYADTYINTIYVLRDRWENHTSIKSSS